MTTKPSTTGEAIASHERSIAALEKRQAGLTYLDPLRPEVAEKQLAAHRASILRHRGASASSPAGDS